MIEHLAVKGYRVFRDFETDLKPGINVLIGTNGSGKSTLVELLRIIQSCCSGPIRPGIESRPLPGQVFHPAGGRAIVWGLTLALRPRPMSRVTGRYMHSMAIRGEAPPTVAAEALTQVLGSRSSRLGGTRAYDGELRKALYEPESRYRLLFCARGGAGRMFEGGLRRPWELGPGEPMLSRATDPRFSKSCRVRKTILGWRFYTQFCVHRTAPLREPQAMGSGTVLDEAGHNVSSALLSLFTNLDHQEQREDLLRFLRTVVPELATFAPTVDPTGRYVFLQWRERGVDTTLTTADLSDGILRLLMLGLICCDPHPPSLICIDEPETGLHPRLLPRIAGMLRHAAERSQVIVLTHSPDLLCGMPLENIAVVRKRDGEAGIVWPQEHDLLHDLLTEEVAGEREVDRERLRHALVSGEMDELG